MFPGRFFLNHLPQSKMGAKKLAPNSFKYFFQLP